MRRIARFAQRHPHIAIMLSASPVHSNFQLKQMDINLPYRKPNRPKLEAEPLFNGHIP
jgi:LysR family glycine cleavage system transcriptional activator